jgi:CO/xanthine dehydrogenase FAD-binding subunit
VAAVRNIRGSANAYSMVSVAVAATVTRGILRDAVIAIGGVAAHVVRASAAEEALEGRPLPEADALQALVSRPLKPAPSLNGSATLRRYEAGALVALALRDAIAAKGARS